MFFATERNTINVEIQAFHNLTYNTEHDEGPRLNQKINSILLSSRWRSKSCSTIPPSNICYSPAAGSFRAISSSLVNSSSLIPKTRPNRSVRKSVIRTCSVLLKEHGLSSEHRQWLKCSGDRFSTPVSDLGTLRPWAYSRCANWQRKKFVCLHVSLVL